MNIFNTPQKGHYLIKNFISRTIESEFRIKPLNMLILFIFLMTSFVLFSLVENVSEMDINELGKMMIFPVVLFITFALSRKWKHILIVTIMAASGYFWWFGESSLFFAIPLALGALITPMVQYVKEWERSIILRFGKFKKTGGPGIFFILPVADIIDSIVDTRIRSTDFVAETTLTRDSVTVTVDALAFWMVWDSEKAVCEVENFVDAVVLSAQAALRDAIGKSDLTVLLKEREKIGEEIRQMVDRKTTEWGITIQSIEITDIIIPDNLQDVMSRKAQAEREKDARITLGEAEIELSKKLSEAAEIYKLNPLTVKLKELNILQDGLKSGNSLIVLPSSISNSSDVDDIAGLQALHELKKRKQ